MTTGTLHPLAHDYLERLRAAAGRLPREARRDLLADIEAHLEEALPEHAAEAEALTVLDRLGDPEEIVAAESPPPEPDPLGMREWATIFLLLLGGFAAGIGWIVGLILLWSSRAWTTRDKWIGTLVLPGGLVASVFALAVAGVSSAGGSGTCVVGPGGDPVCSHSGGPGTGASIALGVALIVVLAAPIATSVHLARRARRSVAAA